VSKHYSFGQYRVDTAERQVFDAAGTSIALPPKIFDTLVILLENPGRVLAKDVLMKAIWSDSFVEENNLAQNISVLRKTFSDVPDLIETVPKRGYRFTAQITEAAAPERSAARPVVPETHYAQNGEVNIAYQLVGDGPIDIVFVMGWISHLEYFWKNPQFASFLKRLSSFSRLILFDKRGTGLSDRVPVEQLPTLEQRMEDVHAVMDAVGSNRAVLVGVSEGGPMCSLFAATYPERTQALVMIGTYAKRIRDDDYPWAPSGEQREAFFELMKRDWGKPVGIEERAPSMADDEAFREWWATYLRMGASPGAAVALTKMNAEIDVRNVLPSIRVPTLVIHRVGDLCLKVEEGRYVASKIPGAKYVELSGSDHLPFVGEQLEIVDEIERFVTGSLGSGNFDRVLATVANVRIIDPKTEAQKRGDEDWNRLLDGARTFVRRQLELHRGREVSYDENGVLATFDGPARAIRCAQAISDSAIRLGVGVKTGLHTGECDVKDGRYSGFAVELAKQIALAANAGDVLASRTVKDLVAGSGIKFQEAGTRSFQGIEGDWRLFSV
jgi:pimeloyl-ACP methyl ester carboxylesterase